MNKLWFGVGIVFFLVILTLYLRRERYEEPQASVPMPHQQAVNNPALESLKLEFKACGDDKECVRQTALNMLKKNNK
jgi:hypothetical protein